MNINIHISIIIMIINIISNLSNIIIVTIKLRERDAFEAQP